MCILVNYSLHIFCFSVYRMHLHILQTVLTVTIWVSLRVSSAAIPVKAVIRLMVIV